MSEFCRESVAPNQKGEKAYSKLKALAWLSGWRQSSHLRALSVHWLALPFPTLCLLSEIPPGSAQTLRLQPANPRPHPHSILHPKLTPPALHVLPRPCAQPQTSTSCGPGTAAVAATPMSKQVTIMTWALHRLTHCSKAAVACSRATRYSADSGSSSGSTSTGEKETVSGYKSGQRPYSSNSSRKSVSRAAYPALLTSAVEQLRAEEGQTWKNSLELLYLPGVPLFRVWGSYTC